MAKDPAPGNGTKRKNDDLSREVEELRDKVRELEETLDAIRSGEVDAIVVPDGEGRKIYTLESADQPYRVLVENIREGALTLSRSGLILYANTRFSEMVKKPSDTIVGTSIIDHICPEYKAEIEGAIRDIRKKACRSRVRIHQAKGSLPVMISMNPLDHAEDSKISVVLTDRRKDEDRIQMQARMLDSVGDAVIAADIKNKIIYWNDAATKTYGWTPEEAIGRDLVEVATPEISHRQAREIADRLRRGETWAGEYTVKHRDGHEFPIYASDAPVFDDNGKLIAILGASHDITARKQAERDIAERNQELKALNEDLTAIHEELQQSNDELLRANESLKMTEEELLTTNDELVGQQAAVTHERDRVKNLLDIAGVMILALDSKGKVTLVNRRGCEILGLPESEILGKDWVTGFVPREIRPAIQKTFRQVIAGELGGFSSYENPVLTHGGKERDILWSNALIRDGEGRITGLLSSGEDITERNKAEGEIRRLLASVREEKERLATLLGSIPDEVWFADANGKIELVNQAVTTEFGPSVASGDSVREVAGSLEVFLPDGTPRPIEEAPLLRALRGEVVREREEIIRTPANNELRYRQVNAAPVKDAGGKIIGSISVVRDITTRRDAEESLRQKNNELNVLNEEITSAQEELTQNVEELTNREKQLSEALAEKEVLLSEIHHRVKNNLTAFISLLSLEGTYEESPAGKALKKDLQNRARTMALIHETLYKTRQYSDVDMEVYLSTLVEQVVGSYSEATSIKTIVDAKGITLDLARATPIGLIVNELVTNSLKYAFPKETVALLKSKKEQLMIGIRITTEEGHYLMKVCDNGVGMPADFDLAKTQTLGLKLVNFLAKHQLRSKPEIMRTNGTEFVFRFRK